MEEINLDFLETLPRQNNHADPVNIHFSDNELNVKLGNKKGYGSKRFEMALTIAKVDELVQEIDKLRRQNIELQQQLKDFQVTAQQVQELYTKEKNEHAASKYTLDDLKKEYHKIDVHLTNVSMVNDQLNARLAQYDGRPIKFENLAVKYVKLMNKLEGHDILKYNPEKDLVEKLREYCASMKLKIRSKNSPTKLTARGSKVKTQEAEVQCNLLEENSINIQVCTTCKIKPEVKDQYTQCSTVKHDQASQYISTMITRQTYTEKVLQKHVQTMFPEAPAIDDILKIYAKWSNIRSVSPLLELPSSVACRSSQDMLKKFCNTGTCTMLCNIRRKIDYLPPNNSSNIKQEIFTPSVSPIPTSQPITTNRSTVNPLLSIEPGNINSNSFCNLFNSTANSSLSQLSSNAFNELWQIFGKMLLSLLQTSNAGVANTIQNTPLNQQQFLDWLLELYMNNQPQNTSTAQTQTLEQRDVNISESPLFFNNASVLSTNVLRPQPTKTLSEENVSSTNVREDGTNIPTNSNSMDNSTFQTSAADSINGEVQETRITAIVNNLHTRNICESNINEINQINIPENFGKSSKNTKIDDEMLEQIQGFQPEFKLNEKKHKALKRLLKSNSHRKKSFESRKNKNLKQCPVVILTNENNNGDTVETAVDFLKTFAMAQENNLHLEEKFSETEKIFLKQISNKNINDDTFKSEQLTFVKPKPKKGKKSSQKVKNKYHLLFGESESEFEDEGIEMRNSKSNAKLVINSTAKLESRHSKCDFNECTSNTNDDISNFIYAQDCSIPPFVSSKFYEQQSFDQVKKSESTNSLIINIPRQKLSSTNIPTDVNCNKAMPSTDNLEFTGLPETVHLKNTKYSEYTHLNAYNQSINPTSNTNSNLFANIGNDLGNVSKLSSDGCSIKDNVETNNISKTKVKLKNDSVISKEMEEFNIINDNEQDNGNIEVFETYEYFNNKITTLENTLDVIEKYSTENNIEYLPNLYVDDYPDDSMNSHKKLIFSASSVGTDNFASEKSIISPQNFINYDSSDSMVSNQISNEKSSKPLLNLCEYDSSNGCVNSCQIISSASLVEMPNPKERDSSNNKVACGEMIISPAPTYSSDIEKDLEISSDDESLISESNLNDLVTIEHARDSFCEERYSSHCSSQKDKINLKSIETLESQHQKCFNNFVKPKEKVFENQVVTEGDNISIVNCVTEQVSLKTINKSELKQVKDCKLFDSNPNSSISISPSDDNIIGKQKKHIFENASQSTSQKLLPLHSPKNASVNQIESNENSLVLSAIMPSSSTLNDETFNTIEVAQTPNSKRDYEDFPKSSSLNTLSLLDLSNEPSYEKLSYSSMSNTRVIGELNDIQDKTIKDQVFKAQNNIKSSSGDEVVKTNTKENIPVCGTINKLFHTNNSKNDIKGSACQQDLNITDTMYSEIQYKNSEIQIDKSHEIRNGEAAIISESNILSKAPTFIKDLIITQDVLNEHDNNNTQKTKSTLENLELTKTEPMPANVPNLYKTVCIVDENDLNDNLSIENELMIDEERSNNISNELNTDHVDNSILTESDENINDTTDSSNISALLNSSLYNEVLTESFKPIVNDLLKEEVVTTSITPEVKLKRGRKRKSECLAENQPCKRSQRLKAKQIILEESLKNCKTHIELGKYTNLQKNTSNNIQPISSKIQEDLRNKFEANYETNKSFERENTLKLGFFKERETEEDMRTEKEYTNHKNTAHNVQPISLKIQGNLRKKFEPNYETNKSFESENILELSFIKKRDTVGDMTTEKNISVNLTKTFQEEKVDNKEKQCVLSLQNEQQNNGIIIESVQERENFNGQSDCSSIEPAENFIYSDSPQSPVPAQKHSEGISDTFVIIPSERPPQFVPHDSNLTLFDALINSYNNENRKQILETVTTKEFRRRETILNQFSEEINLYCYNEMELDLYCTSTTAINKLFSISPDYNLIQKALIAVAQDAEETNVPESDLPSIIQEMPPRHLSKCLQRIFVFLKNIVTRNSNFCKDLMNNIESLLFSLKKTANLSLQAALNLTQLYLMASKVQEYLQIPKHPARLFVAKCLYFYLHKSVLMIHEVLIWYPTLLPHREDKTYNRSDALISVIQHILMNTKYDMCKPNLRGKSLLSKLRYEYHFEPFKPSTQEVIYVLVEKLKNSQFNNIFLAFGLLCKRMGIQKTQCDVLNQHLLPLANEYYILASKTNEYDKRIAELLEIISLLIKPLPVETDTRKYFNEFARFLNGFERQVIQEAALRSLLRLQRFNVECCYNVLRHFQPSYNLSTNTQAMLKTFLYRRPLTFWKSLKSQNPKVV